MFDFYPLRRGVSPKQLIIYPRKKIFIDLLSFLIYSHLSYFWLLVLFCTMGKEIGRLKKIIYQDYPLQHWGKLFYHIHLLIHHLQVIPHKHLSRIDLIIKTLLPIKNNNTSNKDDIHSFVTPRKQSYSVQATSTTTNLTPLNATLPIVLVELHTTKKLPPDGKEYLCFQINGKSSHAAQCVKSRIMNKAINSILSIDTFEQQCVVIKGIQYTV